MSTILRLVAALPFLFFALVTSGANNMAAAILGAIAAAILWPLLRGSK